MINNGDTYATHTPADVDAPYTIEEIASVRRKIRALNNGSIGALQAHIQAVRLLNQHPD